MKTVTTPRMVRDLLAKAPLGWKRALTDFAGQAGFKLEPRERPSPVSLAGVRPGPIVVSGFFSDTRGIAQGARLSVAALRKAGFHVIKHDISYLLSGDPSKPGPSGVEGGVWLVHCNPPEADPVLRAHPELARQPMFRIGYWAWELPRAPASWVALTSAFHEIWVPSAFTRDSLIGAHVPVTLMPHPVPLASARSQTDAPEVIQFLCFADLRSSAVRKNPSGAIRAFLMAFPKSEEARLMVKISGAKEHPEDLVSIRALIGERPDIILILDRLDAERMSDLFARCDILISLHRSEGFGLPIAEAMAAGKAVIATAWSGNLDFMPLIEVQRVPATVTSVDDAPGIYVDQVWADPDMDRAAASMRRLAQDTVLRRACGAANREAIAMIRFHWDRQALDTRPFARYVSA